MADGEETIEAALVVIAKAPVAGRAKTRLTPPLLEGDAALLAEAALFDTLAAVRATPATRRILLLDGEAGDWPLEGVEIIRQCAGELGARLAGGFADVGGPALLIGMDTPQLTPPLLTAGLALLSSGAHDAVLAPTLDGGYWAIGLARADRRVFEGVPMSTARTGAAQLARLGELGLRTAMLARLRDVDRYADAIAVAAEAPGTIFARAVSEIAHARLEAAA